ncbi:MAG: hypothetical protein H7145_09010 [Akkermansiaceae bacterium]|nr:hypothetical protein [Armatimonadota bacterium]
MTINELQTLLEANREKQFRLTLPGQNLVSVSFHITEVGYVQKSFIDCGGSVHSVQSCVLQAWEGPDAEHRLNAGKIHDIVRLASKVLPTDTDLDVEFEYEDAVISQYPVGSVTISDEAVTLELTAKHTDCLAKELCVPKPKFGKTELSVSCCGPSGCC